MRKALFLGADIGTSSTKVCIFDKKGKMLASARHPYRVNMPRSGWVEQDPEDWWKAFGKCTRELAAQVEMKDLKGMAVTHQRLTFVPVDKDWKPLYPAIVWNDTRGSRECEWASKNIGNQKLYDETGYTPGIWSIYKLLWLKNNMPEVFARIHKCPMVQDLLVHRLTGEMLTTSSSASMFGCLNIHKTTEWSRTILKAMGISEDLLVSPIMRGLSRIGSVSAKAASETLLPEGLPVVLAAGDQPCGILGAGIFEPGILGINGGTSCSCEMVVKRFPKNGAGRFFLDISPSGDYVAEVSVYSGASAIFNWLRKILSWQRKEYDINWEALYESAGSVRPGSGLPLVVPHFSGSGMPEPENDARGAILGLSLQHETPHLVRGIIEGLAMEVRKATRSLLEHSDEKASEIRMYGGSSRSGHFNQIFADVLALPVRVAGCSEATALGAAMCAAVGTGHYSSLSEAVSAMVQLKKTYHPVPENVATYDEIYETIYVNIFKGIRDTGVLLTRLSNKSPSQNAT